MNDYNAAQDGSQGATQPPTQPRATTRWAVALERRISEVTLTDFCHCCLMFLLVVATAKAVFQNGDAQAQSTSSPHTLTMAEIKSEANMRIAEGASAEDVMAWMDQAMVAAGLLEEVPTLEAVKTTRVAIASSRRSPATSRTN